MKWSPLKYIIEKKRKTHPYPQLQMSKLLLHWTWKQEKRDCLDQMISFSLPKLLYGLTISYHQGHILAIMPLFFTIISIHFSSDLVRWFSLGLDLVSTP